MKLELCLDADDLSLVKKGCHLAQQLNVDRIELCAAMQDDGLTPSADAVKTAREQFTHAGLLIMARPREGYFCYSQRESLQVANAIDMAAGEGADGVVIGALNADNKLDVNTLESWVKLAQQHKLEVTFHRAFDALVNPLSALNTLADLEIDRVLSSGTPWGSQFGALDGIPSLLELFNESPFSGELVVGGGVNTNNIREILVGLQALKQTYSIHCFSGVLDGQTLCSEKIRHLQKLIADFHLR